MSTPPPTFAGLDLSCPAVMGVVNVTGDSFSDGGETPTAPSAIARGLEMAAKGAVFIDVGGESTRPGATPTSIEEELNRTVPVVGGLAREGVTVSIDTRHAAVMKAAVEAGAAIINDITALEGEAESLAVAAGSGASVILMHMQGDPRTMQNDPHYEDAAGEVYHYLAGRVAAAEAAGMARSRIAVDPGIGFGKTLENNLDILSRLSLYRSLGCALVLGVSRKSFIARLGKVPGQDQAPAARLPGSIAAGLAAVGAGAHILRVHDVAETRLALDVWTAIKGQTVDD